ncbi:MAG TPA: glycosyltransferase [Candidatus Saccharimonadia bacterium]
MSHRQPTFSIVIASFNGEQRIATAIRSLQQQTYPNELYEIIVVDDGSSDRTSTVAEQLDVRVIRHASNRGIAATRNSGLAAARHAIYVSFDDDCRVAPNWLAQLAEAYRQQPDALGIGSIVAAPARPTGLVGRFMAAVHSGNPTPLTLGRHRHILGRFWSYVVDQATPPQRKISRNLYAVRHLNGATASFPVAALRSVDGWNPSLRWMEDTDVCARLRKRYPNRQLYAEPKAAIIHDPSMSLSTFVLRPFRRGPYNLAYYRSQHLTPPIFPFPLVWLGSGILCLWLLPTWCLPVLVILPQLLYGWWPVRAALERSPWALTFAYIQLAEETSTVAGLVRGWAGR